MIILNKDLPVFPGQAGHEYLHTINLARIASKVGLVSLVHTRDQFEKKQFLEDANVNLYTWENPHVRAPQHLPKVERSSSLRRTLESWREIVGTWPNRPRDTFVQDFQFRNIAGPLLKSLIGTKWECLVVVQSTCAHWLDYLPPFPVRVLVLHDVRSLVYQRRFTFAVSRLEKFLCRLDAKVYEKFERRYCQQYDLVVTVSTADEEWVRKWYNPKRVLTVEIPVDCDFFSPMDGIVENPSRIIFTGMMNHPPNVDAARFFAVDVLPLIKEKIPGAEFWIVGRSPHPSVISLGALPGVIVSGYVDDIRPFMAQAGVIVVPLRFGSGMRNKILEAWGMKKCVVSTSIGAEGLNYDHGNNILIADDAGTMAENVIQLLGDHALRNRLRANGRTVVEENHQPEKLARKFYDTMKKVLVDKQNSDEPIRTLIDLRWMKPGLAGGIENLSRSFLNHLMDYDKLNQYTLYIPAEIKYEFDTRRNPNFQLNLADGPAERLRGLYWLLSGAIHRRLNIDYWRSGEVETLRFFHSMCADVALSLSGYIYNDLYPLKNVLVVIDLQHEYCPEFFSPEVLDERRRVIGDSINHAERLISISEHTKKTVVQKLGIDPRKITTAYPAADPIFLDKARNQIHLERTMNKYGLRRGEYLYFPGNIWPHKNHTAACEALAILRDNFSLSLPLVLSGAVKEAQPGLMRTIQKLKLEDQVRFLGYCPLEDMPALYRGAAMLVYPSYFEGFGIPLVEAMLSECPIVCSNTSSLPEVAGDAAVLVDPRSPEEIARAIYDVYMDRERRSTLVGYGLEQARKFTWQKFTLEIVRALWSTAKGIQ